MVSLLLKELAAARKQEAAAAAELAQVKGELAATVQQSDMEQRRSSGSGSRSAAMPVRQPAAAAAAAGGRIPAFRPAGQAPPPRQGKARPQLRTAELPVAAPTSGKSAQGEAQVLRQDNAELRSQLEALCAHCRHLQRQLGAADVAAKPSANGSGGAVTAGQQTSVAVHVRVPQQEGQQQLARAASPQRAQRARHGEQEGSTVVAAVVCSSPRRSRSPARVGAALVSSLDATGGGVDELAVAVFEASRVCGAVPCAAGRGQISASGWCLGAARRPCHSSAPGRLVGAPLPPTSPPSALPSLLPSSAAASSRRPGRPAPGTEPRAAAQPEAVLQAGQGSGRGSGQVSAGLGR